MIFLANTTPLFLFSSIDIAKVQSGSDVFDYYNNDNGGGDEMFFG